jgi:hypothetical protein
MAHHDDNDTARRAYRLWEASGRPDGRDLEFWLQAEHEAQAAGAPPVTNLDRSLAPADRSRARAQRHGNPFGGNLSAPPEHFMAVIDRAHLRIYHVRDPQGGGAPQFELAEAFDLLAGHERPAGRATDVAGRFPAGSGRGGSAGGSIDERLPMHNENERRIVDDLVGHLTRFFAQHPAATWDFAAGPGIHQAVLGGLPAPIRQRVEVTLVKELTHQTPAQLRAHLGL